MAPACALLPLLLLLLPWAGAPTYDLEGRLAPPASALVGLHGATTPFSTSALAEASGRFSFRKLEAGTYTVVVFFPARGEVRQTVEVGPGTADAKGKVKVEIPVGEERLQREDAGRGGVIVSRRELAIPEKARGEYRKAQASLAHRDAPGATRHLERAVEMAPRFAEAWNTLGTIAYQTRRYEQAEQYFRTALQQDPDAFEPLVNLGGVLVTLNRRDDALKYNLYAVLRRPGDALANSQMGMAYFAAGAWDLAEEYLGEAVRLDPAHFSHPQILLAEVHLRKGQRERAADDLESFLKQHPDDARAGRIRETILKLRAGGSGR